MLWGLRCSMMQQQNWQKWSVNFPFGSLQLLIHNGYCRIRECCMKKWSVKQRHCPYPCARLPMGGSLGRSLHGAFGAFGCTHNQFFWLLQQIFDTLAVMKFLPGQPIPMPFTINCMFGHVGCQRQFPTHGQSVWCNFWNVDIVWYLPMLFEQPLQTIAEVTRGSVNWITVLGCPNLLAIVLQTSCPQQSHGHVSFICVLEFCKDHALVRAFGVHLCWARTVQYRQFVFQPSLCFTQWFQPFQVANDCCDGPFVCQILVNKHIYLLFTQNCSNLISHKILDFRNLSLQLLAYFLQFVHPCFWHPWVLHTWMWDAHT